MSDLQSDLERLGLVSFGAFSVQDEDGELPALPNGDFAKSGTLIGNVGSQMWPVFSGSDEAADGQPHPLDRWTKRVIGTIAKHHGVTPLFPFGGPPWWPFIRWANRLGVFSQSPLGVLVHPTYGPWLAFRAVLLSSEDIEAAQKQNHHENHLQGPCETCVDKPCLSACPVGAISLGAPYAYDRCRSHVAADWSKPAAALDPKSCSTGCLARKACPYGQDYRYQEAHARLHMAAFAGK